ncbi:CotH kinase family protein [Clostridium formicaceticum]|uniref:Inner spore coat protein H n=1 Tax=Clostridium formicaceticum TaxID=1497 RepID=A0AAC9RFM2_9CLOT|nr:CotH kinase family protein [Clostridium formicaceticum]AOY75500.1 hypothetical protein BJL90_06070 [Clostridium formicaceticum]ARE85789.1 Inner spore coat protein H [Clostridium formicaceticum]
MRKNFFIDKNFAIFGMIFISVIAFVFISSRQSYKNFPSDLDFPTIYLYMEEEDVENLYERDFLSDQRIQGFAKTSPKDKDAKKVEVRFRGDSTRYLPKKSFNVRFEEEQDFLFGSNRMNLNASYTDPSLMREKISMDMFKELGLPAPRAAYFNLYINNIYEGLYLHVERIDENLLSHFDLNGKGTLVRDTFAANLQKEEMERASLFGYDIGSIENQEALLRENFSYRGDPDWQSVIDLADWVYNTPAGEDFYIGFQERFYLEDFIDWLAIHVLIGDIDSFADDYWLYLDHEDPDAKWRVIPWDKDLTFGSTYRPQVYVDNDYFAYEYHLYRHSYRDNDMIMKFFQTPQLQEKLFSRMAYLMEEVFTLEYFQNKTASLREYIQDSLQIPPSDYAFILHGQNHHGELGRMDEHIETILDFIELRYQFIRRQMYPAGDEIHTATVDLMDARVGDVVYFTDAKGWTIGKIDIREMKKKGKVTLVAEHEEEIKGINRIWRITPENTDILGDLTLYYRNEIFDFGKQNWYEEEDAIGNQWDLIMGIYKNDKAVSLPSKINPYSNKVTATVHIKDIEELVITYPE